MILMYSWHILKMNKKNKKALSDRELIKKYSDIVPPDFDELIRNMVNEPNPAISKPEKRIVTSKEKSSSETGKS